jgi:maleylacetate reductase
VLGNISMVLHHKLCHALVGTFNLPHALAYNRDAAPDATKAHYFTQRQSGKPVH